jgi:hypothetical protein
MMIDTTTEGGKILADAFRPKYEDEKGNLYAQPLTDLMPCPEELEIDASTNPEMEPIYKANVEKYGFPHWYEWKWANWGVKWDARVEDYDDSDPNEVYVYFDTPWGAPVEFFKKFAEQYPDARFEDEYDEEGMQFEGKVGQSDVGFFDESWEMGEEE